MKGPAQVEPSDLAAEAAVLGAILYAGKLPVEVEEQLEPQDFYSWQNETIYEAISDLAAKGDPVDTVSVANELQRRGTLAKVGGGEYLHTLLSQASVPASAGYYARIVYEKALLRKLAETGRRVEYCANVHMDPAALVERATSELNKLIKPRWDSEDDPMQVVEELLDPPPETAPGITLGFRDLDALIPGLHAGRLVVVGARPGVGKTVMAANIACHVAFKLRQPVVLVSLEMSFKEMWHRIIASQCQINYQDLASGKPLPDDMQLKLSKALRFVGEGLLKVVAPNTMPTVADIRALTRKHKPALVVVDYLQKMTPDVSSAERREREVASVSAGLKLLAQQEQTVVLAVGALNRNAEHRTDRVPAMGDLRDSGQIESDADVILMIHRPDAYERESDRPGEADFIVCKNRLGPTSTVTVAFQGHYQRFVDMAADY